MTGFRMTDMTLRPSCESRFQIIRLQGRFKKSADYQYSIFRQSKSGQLFTNGIQAFTVSPAVKDIGYTIFILSIITAEYATHCLFYFFHTARKAEPTTYIIKIENRTISAPLRRINLRFRLCGMPCL